MFKEATRKSGGQREVSKQARRERILIAAREMIALHGLSGLSIRNLAAQAGVSVRTVYNLIGGHAEILAAIIDVPMKSLEQAMSTSFPSSPLERLKTFALSTAERLIGKADLHRPAELAAAQLAGFEAASRTRTRCRSLLAATVEQAMEQRLLTRDLPALTIARQIDYAGGDIIQAWSRGDLPDEALRDELLTAALLPILAVASDGSRELILAELPSQEHLEVAINVLH